MMGEKIAKLKSYSIDSIIQTVKFPTPLNVGFVLKAKILRQLSFPIALNFLFCL